MAGFIGAGSEWGEEGWLEVEEGRGVQRWGRKINEAMRGTGEMEEEEEERRRGGRMGWELEEKDDAGGPGQRWREERAFGLSWARLKFRPVSNFRLEARGRRGAGQLCSTAARGRRRRVAMCRSWPSRDSSFQRQRPWLHSSVRRAR